MKDGFHSGAVAPSAGEILQRRSGGAQPPRLHVCVLVSVGRMRMSLASTYSGTRAEMRAVPRGRTT